MSHRLHMNGALEPSTPRPSTIPLVDWLKAVAAQLIVLHHLAWFGPMSDAAVAAHPSLPAVQSWLAAYGRYAVATFIVVAGFLAAQSLPPHGTPALKAPWRLMARRYVRLVVPYAVALLLAIACAAVARRLMDHPSVGEPARLGQLLAHLALVHSLLGVESLSAGVWYVAIDFQLYVLLLMLSWLAASWGKAPGRTRALAMGLVAAVGVASLFHFNRDARWDTTALYFFGAYALGVASGWVVRGTSGARWLVGLMVLGVAALWLDFRGRLAVALASAAALAVAPSAPRPAPRLVRAMSRDSYALFLVHFPVCLVVNALFTNAAGEDARVQLVGVFVAWGASNVAAWAFHRWVEQPLLRRAMRG